MCPRGLLTQKSAGMEAGVNKTMETRVYIIYEYGDQLKYLIVGIEADKWLF